jgi:hypothetical protein
MEHHFLRKVFFDTALYQTKQSSINDICWEVTIRYEVYTFLTISLHIGRKFPVCLLVGAKKIRGETFMPQY